MNRTLKTILIVINATALLISIFWLYKSREPHPLIVLLDAGATMLALIFEKQVSNIITKNIFGSKIKVDTEPGSNIHTSQVRDSEIDIKNR